MSKNEVTDYSKFSIERIRGGWRVHYHPHDGGVVFTKMEYKTFDEAVAFIKETYSV
jgi:hypothetical protein